jgi:hypothetical protein
MLTAVDEDPEMATAEEDGNGPVAFAAPTSLIETPSMTMPSALLNKIPCEPGPNSIKMLRMVTPRNP